MDSERLVVFLAGGRATRLQGQAAHTPKALQVVGGVPLLDRLTADAARLGFGRFHFALDHLHEPILEHLRDRGVRFTWSLDDVPGGAGTAGALRCARDHLSEEFVVWLADTLPPAGLSGPLLPPPATPAVARMAVSAQVPDVRPNVTVEQGRVIGYDKDTAVGATHVDAGLYAMTHEVLEHIPDGRAHLEQLWPQLAERGLLEADVLTGRFLDIGTPARLAAADREMRAVRHRG
ncbi:NTP transferase domain-containing protein [Streptomyces sp. NPDC046862]|uniref:nucleotidyltransferase family protein n=1 Tax=Streptomyces sp. NPDC046862 TaxID=3154603 RepID=UPI003453E339